MSKKRKQVIATGMDELKNKIPTALSAQTPGALSPPSPQQDEGALDNDSAVDLPPDDVGDPDADDTTVTENDDGSATVEFADDGKDGDSLASAPFNANLANHLPESVLDDISNKYMKLIEDAVEARQKRDEQYEEGLKRAGLGGPAPGGAEFEGASRVTHPVLAEAYVDFSASAMKELFPPAGPVRTQIEGEPDESKLDCARRKVAFMNHQLTKEIPEYRAELEVLLTQLPAGGSQFLKIYHSAALGRTVIDFVGVDEFILPYNARGFDRAPFRFHRMTKNEFDMEQDIAAGLYRDVSMAVPLGMEEETKTATQSHKIEGKDYNWGANDAGEFVVYEGTCYDDEFDDPKRPEDRQCPYVISIDEGSNKILSIYRNWEEDDKKCEDVPYMVEFKFIPWRGAYGIGLPHLIGDLSAALTGTLRALLDSAHIQNSATAIKLKGRPGGETLSMSPTQVGEVDALAGDDIRKVIMPLSFNGPSPVLLQLLGFLQNTAKGVVTTSEEKIADASGQMPVGTTLALIEQGAKVFSSIHARLHEAQRKVLCIIHRLNYKYLPKEKTKFGSNERDFVMRDDFKGPIDVHPVSDPNIFSETQRFAQMQAVLAMAEKAPTVMDLKKCYERMLQIMKVPDYKELLITPSKPQVMHPAAENVQMMMGKPCAAFPDQDHLAHLQVHLDFLKNPMFGSNEMYARTFIPPMLEHLKQHIMFYYGELMALEGRTNNDGKELSDMQRNDKSWPTDHKVSQALAHASPVVMKAMQSALAEAMPVIQQAMQLMQKLASQQPSGAMDPSFIMAMHELDQRKLEHGDEVKLEQQRLMQAMKKLLGDQAMRMHQLEQAHEKFIMQFQNNLRKASLDNQTDITQEHIKAATGLQQTEEDNATALEIAEMRGKESRMTDGGSMKH